MGAAALVQTLLSLFDGQHQLYILHPVRIHRIFLEGRLFFLVSFNFQIEVVTHFHF